MEVAVSPFPSAISVDDQRGHPDSYNECTFTCPMGCSTWSMCSIAHSRHTTEYLLLVCCNYVGSMIWQAKNLIDHVMPFVVFCVQFYTFLYKRNYSIGHTWFRLPDPTISKGSLQESKVCSCNQNETSLWAQLSIHKNLKLDTWTLNSNER